MPAGVSDYFGSSLGYDLSPVRVHTDGAAAQAAESIGARAFTHGHHIVFAAGEYEPEDSSGRRLLAHELTHVVQQSTGGLLGPASCGEAEPAPVQRDLIDWDKWQKRASGAGKSVVETLVALPLIIPPVATGLILLMVLGRRGVVGSFRTADHFEPRPRQPF